MKEKIYPAAVSTAALFTTGPGKNSVKIDRNGNYPGHRLRKIRLW
ncbi:hypothetical protein AGRO_0905 [Agrobacterium sp. ATCC 31749]|nr:hypothetical protein AGRO_0905 [Agrobacterium sp. ATCC 31749]